jgi:hypothetical protein
MTLGELQHDFRLWLVSGADSAADRLPGATGAGLAVYQNNYRAQLVGCLEESYPQLRAHMGEQAFLHAAVQHIGKYPPHAWTLDAYADEFGATLAALFPDNPDLHELAWIELALGAAFIAADALPVSAADFAGVDWDSVRLELTPTLRLRGAATNAAEIWRALRNGETALESAMLPEPGALVVWRSSHVSCLRAADLLELDALATLQEHGSFGALCEMLVGRLGEDEGIARAGTLLAGWIGAELITGIS